MKLIWNSTYLIFLFFVIFFAGNDSADAASVKQIKGNLYQRIEEAAKNQFSENSNSYRKPTAGQMKVWREAIGHVLNRKFDEANQQFKSLDLPYEIALFTDETTNREYILIQENTPIRAGWGTFVFDLESNNPLILQAPHSVADARTELESVDAFLQTRAFAFYVAGSHRRASSVPTNCTQPDSRDNATYPESDVAHSVETMFHATHETVVKARPKTVAVQLHGMSTTDICPDAFLSTGTSTVTENAERLLGCMSENKVNSVLFNGNRDGCKLTALSNVQGRFSNGETADPCRTAVKNAPNPGFFIHIEQEAILRKNRESWKPVIESLKCAFPTDSQGETNTLNISSNIKKTIEMRVEGKYTFANAQESVWRIDREEIDEKSGESKQFEKVAESKGKSINFDFKKISKKETIYRILRSNKSSVSVSEIQVFEPKKRSSFVFKKDGNPNLKTFISLPASVSPKTRILIVMAGRTRNADDYLDSWVDWGAANDYIIVAPQFDEKNWSEPNGYNFGNIIANDSEPFAVNPKKNWAFTINEEIAEFVRLRFGIADKKYDLFGHSAGGQFVHRFLLVMPKSNVRLTIVANPGFYTAMDLDITFPYGLMNFPFPLSYKDLIDTTNKNVVIMRGTADLLRTENLRQTKEADAQGQNRFERAAYMFGKVKKFNPKSKWELVDVPGIGHDQKGMAIAAQAYLKTKFGLK